MKRIHVVSSLEQANLKLAELIKEQLGDFELDDLILDAHPVNRETDGKRVATVVFAYPPGDFDRIVGCLWPPVAETGEAHVV